MKSLILTIALTVIVTVSAAAQGYWRHTVKKKRIERYEYLSRGWPYQASCASYDNRKPVKKSTVKKLKFHRQQKRKISKRRR